MLSSIEILTEKYISKFLKYADQDLPYLTNKIQRHTIDVIDLEFKKKQSNDVISVARTNISQLGDILNWYQRNIDKLECSGKPKDTTKYKKAVKYWGKGDYDTTCDHWINITYRSRKFRCLEDSEDQILAANSRVQSLIMSN
jgi:hypothetical protein